MDRADQPGASGVVSDGRADLGDQPGQACVRNERRRPETLAELAPGNHPRTAGQELFQELKSLWRETSGLAPSEQLPCLRVEKAVSEADPHVLRNENSRNPKGFRNTSFGRNTSFLDVSLTRSASAAAAWKRR